MWPFACYRCGLLVQVTGDVEEFRHLILDHVMWKEGWPCINSCGDQMCKVGPVWASHARRVITLSSEEFFRAMCGGGTPEEIDVRIEVIRAFLLSTKIIKVDAREMMGDGRVVIDRLHLDNGTILHFGGTSNGALIYKVTKDGQARDQVGVRSETEDGTLRREAQGLPATTGPDVGDASSPDGHLPGCCHGLDAGGGQRVPAELSDCRCGGHQDPAGESVPRRTEDDGNVAASVDGVDP